MTKVMKEQDRTIVLELKKRLSADLQKRVIKFILYGSRARGVDADDSDLDLVTLVDEKTPEIKSALDDLAYGVMWDYDFKPVISLKVFSEARFRNSIKKGMSFYRHVEKEGISL
jgi:predicted nucleotidyltransferase